MEKEERRWIFDEEKRKWACNPSDPCTYPVCSRNVPRTLEFYIKLCAVKFMYSRVSLCVFDCPLIGVKSYCFDFQCVLGMLREHR